MIRLINRKFQKSQQFTIHEHELFRTIKFDVKIISQLRKKSGRGVGLRFSTMIDFEKKSSKKTTQFRKLVPSTLTFRVRGSPAAQIQRRLLQHQ